MFSKFKVKFIAGLFSLLLLLTAIPFTSYASTLTREQLLNKLTVTDPRGNVITPMLNPIFPLKPFKVQVENRPITWNDFLEIMSKSYTFDKEFILKYGNGSEQLIMTKTDITDCFRLLVELESGAPMNEKSTARISYLINSIEPLRNYLFKDSLKYLSGLQFEVTSKGELIETFNAKVHSVTGNKVEILKIGNEGYIELNTLILQNNRPWKRESKIYEIKAIGNVIQDIEAKYPIEYSIVDYKNSNYFVNNTQIPESYNGRVKADDLVEYAKINNNAVVVKNYGQLDGSYVVKGISSKGIMTTYEGTKLDTDKYTLLSSDGKPLDYKNLKENAVITKFGDYLLASAKSETKEISYEEDYIYVDNMQFDASDVFIFDGKNAVPIDRFNYLNYIEKASVVADAIGNPKLIDAGQVVYIADIREIDKNKITGAHVDGDLDVELSWNYNSDRISRGAYRLIISDKIVTYGEKLDKISDKISYFREGQLRIDGDRYYLDSETYVVVEIENDDKDEITYKDMNYEEFLKYHKDTLGGRTVDTIVYYVEDEYYIEDEEDTKNKKKNLEVKMIRIEIDKEK